MKGLKRKKTYILNLLLANAVEALGDLTDLVRLGTVDQGRARGLQTSLEGLDRLEGTELGQGSCLLDLIAGDLTSSGLLESVDDVLAGSSNLAGVSGKRNGEETGVRVGVVLGRGTDLREALGGLGQERGARGPLDGGLTTQEGGEDGSLGLVASGAECAGTREGDHESVAGLAGDALLTTVVFRSNLVLNLVLAGAASAGELLEELTGPLGELSRVGAATDKSNVGLGVGVLGELGEGLHVEVFLKWDGGVRGDVLTETTVESNTVGGIDSQALSVGGKGCLLVLEEGKDVLIQFVG